MNAFEKIREVIAEECCLDRSAITPHTSFMSLGLDSLETADLLMQIEEVLAVDFPHSAALGFIILDDVARYAEHILAKA